MRIDSLDSKREFSQARKDLIRERLNHLVELGDKEDQTGATHAYKGPREQGAEF